MTLPRPVQPSIQIRVIDHRIRAGQSTRFLHEENAPQAPLLRVLTTKIVRKPSLKRVMGTPPSTPTGIPRYRRSPAIHHP